MQQLFGHLWDITGVMRTPINQHQAFIEPLIAWLRPRGVNFLTGAFVQDTDFAPSPGRMTVDRLDCTRGGSVTSVAVAPKDFVFVTTGSQAADLSAGSGPDAPPAKLSRKQRPSRAPAGSELPLSASACEERILPEESEPAAARNPQTNESGRLRSKTAAVQIVLHHGRSRACRGAASTIARPDAWSDEHLRWSKRDLSAEHYVYFWFWADGIHVQARLEDDAQCPLVIIGATPEGKKETRRPRRRARGLPREAGVASMATTGCRNSV
jgi:hypothetical protein